jgi:hypothetical protein
MTVSQPNQNHHQPEISKQQNRNSDIMNSEKESRRVFFRRFALSGMLLMSLLGAAIIVICFSGRSLHDSPRPPSSRSLQPGFEAATVRSESGRN